MTFSDYISWNFVFMSECNRSTIQTIQSKYTVTAKNNTSQNAISILNELQVDYQSSLIGLSFKTMAQKYLKDFDSLV